MTHPPPVLGFHRAKRNAMTNNTSISLNIMKYCYVLNGINWKLSMILRWIPSRKLRSMKHIFHLTMFMESKLPLASYVVKASWNIIHPKAAIGGVLWKTFSKKFRNIHRKTPVMESLFNKVSPTLVISCEYCKIFIMWMATFVHRAY